MCVSTEDHLLSGPTTKAGHLQRACLALLRQHETDGAIPTNGRFLFYELEQATDYYRILTEQNCASPCAGM